MSKSKARDMRDYIKVRREFLERRPYCEACAKINPEKRRHYASDVHHVRGRCGKLLTDTRYWIPICREAHVWISFHPLQARVMGLIAEAGDWNRTREKKAREFV